MATLPYCRSGLLRAGGTSDAVPLLSCSVHEEGASGRGVPAPGWEVRLATLSPCEIRRVLCVF